jgi:hypothetical protein
MFLTYNSVFLHDYGSLFLFGCRWGFLAGWEVQLQDRFGRTYRDAFAAQATFVVDDKCKVVFDGDGLKGTCLLTFAASDTSHVTSLFGNTALVLIDTTHVDAA